MSTKVGGFSELSAKKVYFQRLLLFRRRAPAPLRDLAVTKIADILLSSQEQEIIENVRNVVFIRQRNKLLTYIKHTNNLLSFNTKLDSFDILYIFKCYNIYLNIISLPLIFVLHDSFGLEQSRHLCCTVPTPGELYGSNQERNC